MNTVHLIRNKDTGLYWRGTSIRYGKEQRSPWTDAPAKAWHCWQVDQVDRLFRGHFHPTKMPNYEVVTFTMTEV